MVELSSKNIYLDYTRLLSYAMHIMIVVALRGYGKTYGAKKFAINRHIKHGEKFIYLKRHKNDLNNLESFFSSLQKEFPDHQFTNKGKYFYCDGNMFGQAIPLSSWQKMKSAEFEEYTVLIFDEFIKEKDLSYYLPNEVEAFLNFIDTVFRNREKFWIFMLGNAVTMANPYFMYFKLFPKKGEEFYKKGEFLVHIPNEQANDFIEHRKTTPIWRIIQGTNYEKYSLYNEWKEDNEAFLEKRSKQSKYVATFEVGHKMLGLWIDKNMNLLFFSEKHNPQYSVLITTDKEQYSEGKTLVTNFKQNYYTHKLGSAYLKGQLRFDDIHVRELGYELLKQLKVQ